MFVQLHARIVIVIEGTQGHPVTVYCQPIVFRRLAGCDEAFDAFEVDHLFTSFFCSRKSESSYLRSDFSLFRFGGRQEKRT